MEIIQIKKSEKVQGMSNGGIMVRMTHSEALKTIGSLTEQMISGSPNTNRLEQYSKDGVYFTISVTPSPSAPFKLNASLIFHQSQFINAYTPGKAPKVGMGATRILDEDRLAYTISRVSKSGRTFWMRRDFVTPLHKELKKDQSWEMNLDPEAPERKVHRIVKGGVARWENEGNLVIVGIKDEYIDPIEIQKLERKMSKKCKDIGINERGK